ncbi:MAG: SBBP repeat-containing protein, partial [Ignavibacteria bacterium]|nr:SBBP repeat-containing protein [Ignavibacteria bacterium]
MNKITVILILIITSFIISEVSAQVTQEWVTTYNGTGVGSFYAMKNAVDKFGNLIVSGRTGFDFITLKYNNSGNLLWAKIYDGGINNDDAPRDMTVDDSGNVYVTGYSFEGTSNGGVNWLTIKYSKDGDLLWKRSLDWTGHKSDDPKSIFVDKSYNVYVTGYGYAGPPPLLKEDLVVVKYDMTGNLKWTRSHSSSVIYSDCGYSVVTDDSNFVYVSGYAFDSILTIKYDESGNTIWERTFFNIEVNYVVPLFSKIDKQNNIVVNGFYTVATQDNFVTLKYDRNGNLLWNRIFDSPIGAQDNAYALDVDDNSNIYVAGRTFTNYYFDVLVVKYAPNGDTLWVKTYDGGNNSDDLGNSIMIDILGNAYTSGYSKSDITYFDFVTLKYNPGGEVLWTKKYTNPLVTHGEDIVYGISIDNSNSIIISGTSQLGTNSYGIT